MPRRRARVSGMNVPGSEGTDAGRKTAIFGTLTLYLDFINLFLSLLRLMGPSGRGRKSSGDVEADLLSDPERALDSRGPQVLS
jgi:hypothetical protein